MCAREGGALVCVGRGCVGQNARTLLILLLAYFYYNVTFVLQNAQFFSPAPGRISPPTARLYMRLIVMAEAWA